MTSVRAPSRLLAAVPVVAVAIACLPRLNWVLPEEDSTVTGAWAMQTAAGQVPYRDFFTFTTPGSILLYAGVFRVLGASLLVERLVTLVAILVAAWALYQISRWILPWRWAAAVAIFWGVWMGAYYQYGPHHHWSTTCLLLAALAVFRRRFILAGVASAFAVLFLQAAGVAVVVFCAGAVLVERDLRRSLLPMVAAGLLTAIPFAAWIVLDGSAAGFIRDTIYYNANFYERANAVPFPLLPNQLRDAYIFGSGGEALWLILFGWPLLILVPLLIAVFAVVELWRWRGQGQPSAVLVMALLSTGLFASGMAVRMTAPLAWFVAPLALALAAARLRLLVNRRRAALVPFLVFVISGLIPFPMGIALSCELNQHGWRPISAVGGTMCAPEQFAPQLQAAYDFRSAHPHTEVAYLPIASSYYLLVGEVPPVPNAWIVPVLTMPGQLDTLEEALIRNHVEYVFYFEMPNVFPSPRGQVDFDTMLARSYERSPADDQGGLPAWKLRSRPS